MTTTLAPHPAHIVSTALIEQLRALTSRDVLKPGGTIEVTLERWHGLAGPQGVYVVIVDGHITRFHYDLHSRDRALERAALFVESTVAKAARRAAARR